eukprot:128877_1
MSTSLVIDDEEEEIIRALLDKDDKHRMRMQQIPLPNRKAEKQKILIFLSCGYIFILLIIGICYYFTNSKDLFYGLATICGILSSSYYGKNLYFKSVELRCDIEKLSELCANKSSLRRVTLMNDIDTLSKMNNSLRQGVYKHIRSSASQNKALVGKLNQLTVVMKKHGYSVFEILAKFNDSSNKLVKHKFVDQVISRERDMLSGIFDRSNRNDGMDGLNSDQFEEFMEQLPSDAKRRFEQVGSFEHLAGDDGIVDWYEFRVALNKFEEISLKEFFSNENEKKLFARNVKENQFDPEKISELIMQLKNKHYKEWLDRLPLHQYSENNVADKILFWIFNDINYSKHLSQIIQRLILYDGLDVTAKSGLNIFKTISEKEFSGFISKETFEIIFSKLTQQIEQNPEAFKTKSAAEIGFIIFNYTWQRLLERINDDKINGVKFIKYYQDNTQWIKEATGWDAKEIYQIEAMLFRHKSFNESEIETNMYNIFEQHFDETTSNILKKTILEFDVEQLHYKIKNNKNIHDFTDAVMNTVHLLSNDATNKDKDLVQIIYKAIAECFSFCYSFETISSEETKLSLDIHQDWICSHCGNYNFHYYISSKMRYDLLTCDLCGITKIDSFVLKLRNSDTFVTQQQVCKTDENDTKQSDDEIDLLIQNIQKQEKIKLSCPNRNDHEPCPSIIRLTKHLIFYKNWIDTVYRKTKGNDSIDNTTQVNLDAYTDDIMYKKIFIESIALVQTITQNDAELLTKMFVANKDDIANVKTFLSFNRKQFINTVKKHTKIKPAALARFYKTLLKSLRENVQTQQFATFLSDFDAKAIDMDYHHILNTHINNGNKLTIEHVFRFFGKIIHYEDCRSFNRKE